MRLVDLIPSLQIAIGPVILISGVALLMGSINNRLGRTIDRSRGQTQIALRRNGRITGSNDPEMKRSTIPIEAIDFWTTFLLAVGILVYLAWRYV